MIVPLLQSPWLLLRARACQNRDDFLQVQCGWNQGGANGLCSSSLDTCVVVSRLLERSHLLCPAAGEPQTNLTLFLWTFCRLPFPEPVCRRTGAAPRHQVQSSLRNKVHARVPTDCVCDRIRQRSLLTHQTTWFSKAARRSGAGGRCAETTLRRG